MRALTWLGGKLGQAGPEQKGFWGGGSYQPSAVVSAAWSEDGAEAPTAPPPSAMRPRLQGPGEKGAYTCPPSHRRHPPPPPPAGISFLLLKKPVGIGCSWAPCKAGS